MEFPAAPGGSKSWVFPTPYGAEVGVRAFGRTDEEIIERLCQTV
jgi:hypothetical protein